MIAEIIAVGTEILSGDVVNTNATFLSKQLAHLGIKVCRHVVVEDDKQKIARAFKQARRRADIIITTGGLGPTYDDLTKVAISQVLKMPLDPHSESYIRLIKFFKDKDNTEIRQPLMQRNAKQAYLPEGSIVLENENGTAPGIFIVRDNLTVIMLPGPPFELQPMFLKHIYPYFQRSPHLVLRQHDINIFDVCESEVEELLDDIIVKNRLENPTIATYANLNELMVRVTAGANTIEEAEKLMAPIIDEINDRLYDYTYDMDAQSIEHALVRLFKKKNLKLAVAESCTGGLIASRIVSIPGASDVLDHSIVAYENKAKQAILGVKRETLKANGAISGEAAMEMAQAVRSFLNSDVAIASTGVAGPTTSEGKHIGLVYLAVASRDSKYDEIVPLNLQTKANAYERQRDYVMQTAASHALHLAFEIGSMLKENIIEEDNLFKKD